MDSLNDRSNPRMPFTSPMTDTTSSPSSSTSSKRRQGVLKKSETDRIGKDTTEALQQARSNLPELNLVTNFSKLHESDIRGQNSSSKHRRQESLQERRRRAKLEGTKGPIDNIKSLNSRVSGLSPSDGTLVIGISPDSIQGQRNGLTVHNSGNHMSLAPEIVITPADLESPWSTPNISKLPNRRRPSSSMYSQATQHNRGISQFGIVIPSSAPPVPPLPKSSAVRSAKMYQPNSAVSWATAFSDDDHDDETSGRRRFSGESQQGILRCTSLDTPTARHRSRGWWNQLISPVFERSNTIMTKRSIDDSHDQKPSRSKHGSAKDIGTYPILSDQSRNDGAREAHASFGSDMSRWKADRQTLAFFRDDSPDDDAKRELGVHQGDMVFSPEFVATGGFGAASEYYEACWHDANSPTPFFECQNHDCSGQKLVLPGLVKGGPDHLYDGLNGRVIDDAESSDATNSLVDHGGASIRAMDVGPSDITRSVRDHDGEGGVINASPAFTSEISHVAKSPHIRHDSETTEIDDEPDAASEVHEAKVPPTGKVDSPSPAIHTIPTGPGANKPPPELVERSIPADQTPEIVSRKPSPFQALNERPRLVTVPKYVEPQAERNTAAISPDALTPGLQRDIQANNALPMVDTRAARPTIVSERSFGPRDPLQINEPRAAPKPPQLQQERTPPVNALGIDEHTSSPAPSHAVRGLQPTGVLVGEESTTATPQGYTVNQFYGHSQQHPIQSPPSEAPYFEAPPGSSTKTEASQYVREVKDEKPGKSSKAFKLVGCFGKGKPKKTKKEKRLYMLIGGALLAMIILILVLILTLTLKRNDIPVQTSFLNITGFPPMPTGIATIARPDAVDENNQCVAPTTLWSCALPKEQQGSIVPNNPNQPNFRIEIRFQNGSVATNSSLSSRSVRRSNAASAGSIIRNQVLRIRDSFTDSLFTPNPSPPSQEDQAFLGNTTDNNTTPFAGEATPFFMSFLPTTVAASQFKLIKRQDVNSNSTTNSSDPFPDISNSIPAPSINSDGTAAAANLLPFPSSQPLRLYNRGQASEHYGFYTYFDRSIFLKSAELLNSSALGEVPDDENGGAEETAASVRCTWTQTRFLVQIWTNAGEQVELLPGLNDSSSSSGSAAATSTQGSSNTPQATATSAASASSANDFSRPGSFPYPVSITMDRHGGDVTKKMIYCYGMDNREHIIVDQRQIHLENRTFGGVLVNPAQGLFKQVNVSVADGGPGGIDGGSGGCQCKWNNFQGK